MVSNVAYIFMLMYLVATCVAKANSAICQCSCCVGQGCKPIAKPPVFIPSCKDGACGVKCTTTFPNHCAVPTSVFTASCSSATSTVINRHALSIIFGMAFALFVKQIS
ncbi:unnamed protein product [Rotaria sp. Silwood1]|nr:unnamed protein product [Rotaria sp. Silwood1]CAF1644818.1 unnamed protein product [Rotaria sp. Silwood1]CAF3781722.1 unnamed protein product [Rotaria sp. Silwood1]CAF3829909.1 unnamed protein product [Rotaria sp. Silwood1]CAF3858026.1 unnamed protein product [Rotaria sp. Silwood1]